MVRRAKRSRAQAGVYLRGNRPPYGFRHEPCAWDKDDNVTERRLVPDERPFVDLGFPTLFAATPYEARRVMIERYASGVSFDKLASLLTAAGVPTSARLAGWASAKPYWHPFTVGAIVTDPLNQGILTNIRQSYEHKDPDDKHAEEWVKTTKLPLEQHIHVTPPHGLPEPLVDDDLLARIAYRRATNRKLTPLRVHTTTGALLAGGLAVCALCGGGVHTSGRFPPSGKVYRYYSCRRHQKVPSACPGWALPVALVDPGAWFAVEAALVKLGDGNESYLDHLAAKQADLAASEPPSESLDLCGRRVTPSRRK